jgi:hypothetical protein
VLNAINDRFDSVDGRLNRIDEKLEDNTVSLAQNSVVLEEHQRRSAANEEAVRVLRTEIKPLATHVAVVGAIAKILAAAGTLVGIAVGLQKLLSLLT